MRIALTVILFALNTAFCHAQIDGNFATFQATSQDDTPTQLDIINDAQIWSHFAGNAKHQSQAILNTSTPSLSSFAFIASSDGITTYIPVPQSGIIADRNRLYTIASDSSQPGSSFAVAFDRFTGDFQWATPIPPTILDSWSTPTIDIQHNQLLIPISNQIIALDTSTGNQVWSTQIEGIIVNASLAVSNDLGHSDRAFITNYSFGGGSSAKLICINTDPFDLTKNPYQPGEIVWQSQLGGDSSGNTPAYSQGVVYVSAASGQGSQAGTIQAFDATATSPTSPMWTFTNTINAGFFSGVSIAHGHLYASSFNFNGLQFNSNTIKLNKNTGTLIWSVPTNRTDATPIVLPNGDLIVSGGVATGAFDFLPFFGSLPSIQYIQDNDTTAIVLWDSALETLDDTNSNGLWDFGESFLSIGGWTHQPVALTINNTLMLLVGTLRETQIASLFEHNTNLSLIDLSKNPTDPNFIIEEFSSTGSTPAILGSWIYSPGEAGIHAFAPLAPAPITNNELLRRYTQGQLTMKQFTEQLIEQLAK